MAVVKLLRSGWLSLTRRLWTFEVKFRCAAYQEPLTVNHRSPVTKKTTFGRNVHLNGLSVAGTGSLTIGSNVHTGTDVLIITSNHDFDGGSHLPYDAVSDIEKAVIIGDNVWLGSRVVILPGAVLGEGSIIQAGSVVTGEVPRCAIAGGHPAKVFRYRDVEHYERLKAAGLFA